MNKIATDPKPAMKYRYRCESCKSRGRWFVNPNDACATGEVHYTRHEYEHECHVEDQKGNNVGPCH
jgi:hypothetical protein